MQTANERPGIAPETALKFLNEPLYYCGMLVVFAAFKPGWTRALDTLITSLTAVIWGVYFVVGAVLCIGVRRGQMFNTLARWLTVQVCLAIIVFNDF